MTAAAAIARSISHNEIVTLDFDAEIAAELSSESDDSAKTDGVTEYWGTSDDGDEWRVHMRRA